MQSFTINQFLLESKETIQDLEIAYQTFGTINEDQSNIIWVFHAISGDTEVLSWWSGLFREGKVYDPKDYFIICANCIGSPFGSSRPKDFSFPQFTVRDLAKAYMDLAQHLDISSIHTVIGGSFGGYQALEFAYSYEGKIDHMILLASSSRESAWGIAVHEAQRMALRADSTFGNLDGGLNGLKAARALAMLTYRTSEILIKDQTDINNQIDDFKASSYVNYQGHKFSEKFDSLCLYYLTKCIDSHNLGRDRGGESAALKEINIPSLIIGFKSDLLVPIESQRYLAKHLPNAFLSEIDSSYGHDGFLMEDTIIEKRISEFYQDISNNSAKRVFLKFGGSSLYGKKQLEYVLDIIKDEHQKNPLALVVSARGKTTDKLIELHELASQGLDFHETYNAFVAYSIADVGLESIEHDLAALKETLEAIRLLKINTEKTKDKVLVFGELIAAKSISTLLKQNGYQAEMIDARNCIFCEQVDGRNEVKLMKSKTASLQRFSNIDTKCIPVITGYIASNEQGDSVTLGRNGSNYSASLFAQFLQAIEIQNWTDIDGIYSADPSKVDGAIKIKSMNYKEANELASFGMNLLHSKTILPLKQSNIPLYIKSTKFPKHPGTVIDEQGGKKGIKAITSVNNVALVTIEGNELKENIGIDARIFSCLQSKNINIKMISQASTENGIGFVISEDDAPQAKRTLLNEFKQELSLNYISSIQVNPEIGIVAIIGRHNFSLEKAIYTLRKNKIWMHLISNSISGKNISLVVDKEHLYKAVNLVHKEVYETTSLNEVL